MILAPEFRIARIFLIVGTCYGWPSWAQGVIHSAADGIFTTAQAQRGKQLYFDNCVACHGDQLQGGEESPSLAGSVFLKKWGPLPLSAIFQYINTEMPLGQPGSLGANANADILAYILSVNNVPAGATELSPDLKILSGIILQAKQ